MTAAAPIANRPAAHARNAARRRARKPRIGLVTYGLDRPLSGVGRVALELGRALHASGECEVVFLTPYARGLFRDGPVRDGPGPASVYLRGCALLPGLMAFGGPTIALAARRFELDLVHDPVGVSPFTLGRWAGRFKRITTIHDAIAFRHPEGYPWLNNFLHRRYVPATLGNVDRVITVSEHARRDLAAFLGLAPGSVDVVPNGVSPHFRPVAPDAARGVARRHGIDRPYTFTLGAIQSRKNLGGLVEAFARLRQAGVTHQLVIAGPALWQHGGLRDRIARLGLGDAVTMLGYVPEADLPALYSAADLFAIPSLYEGFGLPLLEAMACGTPVVCSQATSLPEVAGDAALLVDASESATLADGLRRVLEDRALAADLSRAGRERAAQFTWQSAAEKTIAVYRRALGENE